MKQIFETILIKREGKLEHTIKAKEKILNDMIKDLPEGIKIEVFANTMSEKGSNAQLAKIHAMLKQLAHDIGEDPGTLKEQIKESGNCLHNLYVVIPILIGMSRMNTNKKSRPNSFDFVKFVIKVIEKPI